jgi:hypothetical protein
VPLESNPAPMWGGGEPSQSRRRCGHAQAQSDSSGDTAPGVLAEYSHRVLEYSHHRVLAEYSHRVLEYSYQGTSGLLMAPAVARHRARRGTALGLGTHEVLGVLTQGTHTGYSEYSHRVLRVLTQGTCRSSASRPPRYCAWLGYTMEPNPPGPEESIGPVQCACEYPVSTL